MMRCHSCRKVMERCRLYLFAAASLAAMTCGFAALRNRDCCPSFLSHIRVPAGCPFPCAACSRTEHRCLSASVRLSGG